MSARAQSVCLLLPGLLQAVEQAAEAAALPAISRLLSRASTACPDVRTFEQVALEWFNVRSTNDESAAAQLGHRIEFGQQNPSDPGQTLFRADPVYQQIDLHSILLGDPGLLELSTDDAQALIESLNRHLAGDGISLSCRAAQRWYLHASDKLELQSTPITAAVGRNIAHTNAVGGDAGKWQKLLTECQMVLFDHPVNRQRELAGKLPVNSLWLWGEGALPVFTPDGVTRKAYSGDFYVRSLADFTSATTAAIDKINFSADTAVLIADRSLQTAVNTGDGPLRSRNLASLEQQVFQPLWRNLSSSRVRQVNLWTGRRWLQVNSRARRQFWRRTRPFETFLESDNAE